MKLRLLTKFITLSAIPTLGLAASCSYTKSESQIEKKYRGEEKEKKEKKEIEYKTYVVQFSNNILLTDWNNYNEFLNELNKVPELPNEYKHININFSKLGLNQVFERESFERRVLSKVNKIDLKFKLDDKEKSLITLNPKTSADLKEIEKLLQKDFNNYYVNESWFVDKLKEKIKLAESGLNKNDGKITLKDSEKNNKLEEYNAVVNEIKNFLNEHANIVIDNETKISEINQDTIKGWSLVIKLKSTNLESNSIKLDFRKPDVELTDEQIKEKNLANSIAKKIKIKINEYFDDSKLEDFFKFIKLLILVDKNGVLNEKITDSIQEILLNKILQLDIVPKFVARNVIKVLRPQIKKLVDKAVTLMRVQ